MVASVTATGMAVGKQSPPTGSIVSTAALDAGTLSFVRMNIDGPAGPTGWIEIESWSWGVANTGSGGAGGGGGSGVASFQDFHFTKRVDSTSPLLMKWCAEGRHLQKVTIEMFTMNKKGNETTYMVWVFEDLLVSSYQTGGSSGSDTLPTEQVSLNYAKVSIDWSGPGDETSFGWDLAEGRQS